MTETRTNWTATALVAIGVSILTASVTYFRTTGVEQGQDSASIAEMSKRMDEGFTQVRRDLDRIDQNGVTRRSELREEMTQLHNQQQRDIDDIKNEMRLRRIDG